MTLRALGVAAILFAFTTTATAGRSVDWSDYMEKPGESRQLVKTTPEPKAAQPASAKKAPTAKKAKSKRVARQTKAKTSKTKSKRR